MSKVITRFAPSPTGLLHVGNIRTALVNFLYARKTGGEFILRNDDTDQERSRDEYKQQIELDMQWLGLNWDSSFSQSARFGRYDELRDQLIERGLLYPCFETKEELDIKRKFQLQRGQAPVYDRAALKLSSDEVAAKIAAGEKPHYRFKLTGGVVKWHDMVRGEVNIDTASLSDPILVREDGGYTYTLCSVVDDGDYGVTHIIRGEDHVANSGVQVEIFKALGYSVPEFGHVALIKAEDGALSKRLGGGDIKSMREDGLHPLAILSVLAKIGTSDAVRGHNMDELVDGLDFSRFSRNIATYNIAEVERINAEITHAMSYDEAARDFGVDVGEATWLDLRENLVRPKDVAGWTDILEGDVDAGIDAEDKAYIADALAELPVGDYSEATFGEWTKLVKAKTGRKGKGLFMPLRIALTGRRDGPEMKVVLKLLGEDKARVRLQKAAG